MSELACLELSVLLWLAHMLTQGAIGNATLGPAYLAGPRDENRETTSVAYGRATRALANYVENLAPFVALDLGLIATGHTGGIGATIWVFSRIAYLPLYLAGTHYVRSFAYFVSIVGLLMMLARLAGF